VNVSHDLSNALGVPARGLGLSAFVAPPAGMPRARLRRTVLASLLAVGTCAAALPASAQGLVSVCSGIALPRSAVLSILNPLMLPLTGAVDSLTLGTLNLQNTYTGLAAGQPLSLTVLDTNGNILSPSAPCNVTADGYSLNTARGLSIGGNRITGLGTGATAQAVEGSAIALGDGAGTGAGAANAVALGSGARVLDGAAGSVALGAGSVASGNVAVPAYVPAGSGYAVAGASAAGGELSVGDTGSERRITHVAAGAADTDAVNVSQLKAVAGTVAANAVQYDDPGRTAVTLGGAVSTDGGTTGGARIGNLARGTLSATSTDAVNGAQLFETNTNVTNLGNEVSNIVGGKAGLVQQVGGAPGSGAITVGAATGGTVVDFTGTAGARVLSGVAAGSLSSTSTEAVNGAQLFSTNAKIDTLSANAVQYDNAGRTAVTLAGPASTDGGATGGTRVGNVAQGTLSATSTDAVNGAQLFETNTQVTNLLDGRAGLVQQVGGAPGNGVITVGVATGGTVVDFTGTAGARVLSGVAAGVAQTDAVNVGQLDTAVGQATANAVRYDDASRATVTLGGPPSTDGGATGGTRIGNVAQGAVSATSAEAVNGAQLFQTNTNVATVVDALGGNATVNPDGSVSGPVYAISTIAVGGSVINASYTTVGDALGALGGSVVNLNQLITAPGGPLATSKFLQVNSTLGGASATGADAVALGPQAVAGGSGAVAVGLNAQAAGSGALALGTGAVAASAGGVALGAGADAGRAGLGGRTEAVSGVAVASVQGAVSVGVAGAERQIIHVAGGTEATDAVNLRQLQAVQAGSVSYATAADGSVNYGQVVLGNGQAPGGTVVSNVAPGVAPTDAVNVQQLQSGVGQAMYYSDLRIRQLQQGMQDVARRAYAGVAAAMALESAPMVPGKLSYAAGVGHYEGQSAVGVSLRRTAASGQWSLTGGVSATGAGGVAARIGVAGVFD